MTTLHSRYVKGWTTLHHDERSEQPNSILSRLCSICVDWDFRTQGDNACDVEATEVQADILDCNTLCAHTDPAISQCCLLGFRGPASKPFQCLVFAPEDRIPRHCCRPNAHAPGDLLITIFHPYDMGKELTRSINRNGSHVKLCLGMMRQSAFL